MKARWRVIVPRIFSDDRIRPFLIAASLTVVAISILWALSPRYVVGPGEILPCMYVETTGAATDIVVFGVILLLLTYRRERS